MFVFILRLILIKKFLAWYYNRKIAKKQIKLSTLKEEKKKTLETVMETETYKVAKTILEKFAPEQFRKTTPLTLSDSATPKRVSLALAPPAATGMLH